MAKKKRRKTAKRKGPPQYPKGSKFVGGPIEAKPTTYRGVQFKSRLEARWAVYLDFHPMIDLWEYEPRTFHCRERGWDYTPDFVIQLGTTFQCWLEVKPTIPTDEYLAVLSIFVPMLPGCVGHHLLLCTGDFFKGQPQVFGMLPGQLYTGKQIEAYNEDLESIPILGHPETVKIADGYRFDLPEQNPIHRTGNDKRTPFDHWREWQEKQSTAEASGEPICPRCKGNKWKSAFAGEGKTNMTLLTLRRSRVRASVSTKCLRCGYVLTAKDD